MGRRLKHLPVSPRICANPDCGILFTPHKYPYNQKYHSRACFYIMLAKTPKNRTISEQSIEIAKMRHDNPCLTLQQIGNKYGISRERVRQVLAKQGAITKHYHEKILYTCLNCGKVTPNKSGICSKKCKTDYNQITLICDNCGKLFNRVKNDIIRASNNENYKGHQFCNNTCFGEYKRTYPFFYISKYDYNSYDLNLFECLYLSGLQYKDIMNKMEISYKECIAIYQYLRKNKRITRQRKRKYDYTKIKELYLQNKSYKEITDILGMSYAVLSGIIVKLRKKDGIDRPHFTRSVLR